MKKKSAWLVAWEASSERRLAQVQGPRILAFFDGRKSAATIQEIVIGLYLASSELNHEEKAYYGLVAAGKKMIIKYEFSCNKCIKCGLNPWVVARLVEDFEVEPLDGGDLIVRWKEPAFTYPRKEGAIPIRRLECKEERISRT